MSQKLIELQPITSAYEDQDAPPSEKIIDQFNNIFDSYSLPKVPEYEFKANTFWGYLSPFERKTLLWDLFVIVCMYVFFFEMGFLLAFTSKFWINLKSFGYTVSLYVILLVVFILDIGVGFHKGFYKVGQGYVITDRKRIARHYLRSYFTVDLITLACVVLPLTEDSVWNFFQVFFLVKYFKLRSYERQIHQGLEKNPNISLAYSLITLFVNACLVSHYLSAIFIRVDVQLWKRKYYGDDPVFYWLSNNSVYPLDEMNGTWLIQYIYGQNFALGTLSTMAPGPFPKNQIEVVYTNFVMIGLIILSSFLADSVVKIFYWEAEKRAEHETNIQSFCFFLETKQVSDQIKYKTQNYFELIWEIEGKRDKQAQQAAMQKLSAKLRDQLLQQIINLKYISFLGYFREDEEKLKGQLIQHFTESLTESGQVLFTPDKNQPTDFKIFIVSLGMIEFSILGPNSKLTIGFSKLQRVLGIYEFITQQNYFYEGKTIHLTNYYSISRRAFMEIIEKLNLKETFSQIRYKVEIEDDLSIIDKRCLLCFERHRQINCPKIMYTIATKIDYQLDNYVNKRQKCERLYKKSKIGNSGMRKKSTSSVSSGINNNPFELFNNLMLGAYIREVLDGQKFEECQNYLKYLPKHNINSYIS